MSFILVFHKALGTPEIMIKVIIQTRDVLDRIAKCVPLEESYESWAEGPSQTDQQDGGKEKVRFDNSQHKWIRSRSN